MKHPPIEAMALAKWLLDEGACSAARVWQEGKSLVTVWESCERGDWIEWLLSHCNYQWKAPAWDEYKRVKALALDEYERVKADTIRKLIPYPFEVQP